MTLSIEEIADALRSGDVVGLPTDTVYGLGVRADLAESCEKIFALKGRPDSVPLPVLIGELSVALSLTAASDQEALEKLGTAFWPGALSVVVSRNPDVKLHLGGNESTIGLRLPENADVRHLADSVGPLAVSSANRHGEPPCQSPADIVKVFGESLPYLDGGECSGEPSTVISVTNGLVRCYRQGPIALDDISELLGRPVAE